VGDHGDPCFVRDRRGRADPAAARGPEAVSRTKGAHAPGGRGSEDLPPMSDSEVPTTTAARAGEAAPAGRTDSILLEVRGVTKTYRRGPEEVHALRDVTFDLRRHEVVALVGPSGS